MTTYSELRRFLYRAIRDAENLYVETRDAGASADDLACARECQEAILEAWRKAGLLADEV